MCGPQIPTPTAGNDVTGLLIIRAWTEHGSAEPLRAQVRLTSNVGTGFDRTVTLCRPDEVTALVSAWLKEFAGPSAA